nr:PREDICTED: N-acetylmuramoyl-L-alanine amidase [Lepisosteus oculatus]
MIPALLVLCSLCVGVHGEEGLLSWHLDDVIRAVELTERSNPGLDMLGIVRTLRSTANHDDSFLRHFLGPLPDGGPPARTDEATLAPAWDHTGFVAGMFRHRVTAGGQEEGVVLTPDGTTTAVAPMLLGIEAGLQRKRGAPESGIPDALYSVTLAKDLGLSFVRFSNSQLAGRLGPDGCWDSLTAPRNFTLSGPPALATDALVNGAMDGVVLGDHLSREEDPPKLSQLLKLYFHHNGLALDSAPRLQSNFRRGNFGKLANATFLQEQIVASLSLYRGLMGDALLEGLDSAALESAVREGLPEFVHRYMVCPAIIPRCMWGAEPYRGTPTPLVLPLSFLYIHHTYGPSLPCLTFPDCARDMRAMQRFHQDDRGWDDIGYRHNSLGYGVSFIGDYTATLPARRAMALVRERLTQCAVDGGRLVSNFTIHGHRQLVNTSCPGDKLYTEITGWEHFREVQPKPPGDSRAGN